MQKPATCNSLSKFDGIKIPQENSSWFFLICLFHQKRSNCKVIFAIYSTPFSPWKSVLFLILKEYQVPDTTTIEIIQWKSDKCFLASNLHIKWQNMSLCKLLAHQRNISQVIFSDSTTLKKENQQHKVSTLHSQEMKGIFLSWYY